ncbi:hypothetical protein, partial [Escherichia coli]|uniref:hypothetical protein n=1 Tax=Escherichia coli TaxID=562 RepID=UPI001BC8645F
MMISYQELVRTFPNTFLSNNIHYSAETVRLIKEAEIAIQNNLSEIGNDSNLLIVFYVQIMPDD